MPPYQEVGSYRAAAEICGTTDKTVKRVVEAATRVEVMALTEIPQSRSLKFPSEPLGGSCCL